MSVIEGLEELRMILRALASFGLKEMLERMLGHLTTLRARGSIGEAEVNAEIAARLHCIRGRVGKALIGARLLLGGLIETRDLERLAIGAEEQLHRPRHGTDQAVCTRGVVRIAWVRRQGLPAR